MLGCTTVQGTLPSCMCSVLRVRQCHVILAQTNYNCAKGFALLELPNAAKGLGSELSEAGAAGAKGLSAPAAPEEAWVKGLAAGSEVEAAGSEVEDAWANGLVAGSVVEEAWANGLATA